MSSRFIFFCLFHIVLDVCRRQICWQCKRKLYFLQPRLVLFELRPIELPHLSSRKRNKHLEFIRCHYLSDVQRRKLFCCLDASMRIVSSRLSHKHVDLFWRNDLYCVRIWLLFFLFHSIVQCLYSL